MTGSHRWATRGPAPGTPTRGTYLRVPWNPATLQLCCGTGVGHVFCVSLGVVVLTEQMPRRTHFDSNGAPESEGQMV